jgi:hypothetical protein
MESIDFRVGDIIVDTKYNDFFGIGGGHAFLVTNVTNDGVAVTHTGQFGLLPATHVWKGYKSYKGNNPDKYEKYLIRWKSDAFQEKIHEKLLEIVKIFYVLREIGVEISGSELIALRMAYNNACFNQVVPFKMLHRDSNIDLYYVIGRLIANKTFICSSYVMLIWKLVLEQIKFLDKTIDDIALKIDPFECLPKNIIELPNYFPDYWELIEFYTTKS